MSNATTLRYLFLVNLGLCLFIFPFVVFPGMIMFDYNSIRYTMRWTDIFDGQGPVGETWMFFGVRAHCSMWG